MRPMVLSLMNDCWLIVSGVNVPVSVVLITVAPVSRLVIVAVLALAPALICTSSWCHW